jgi:hypothetical protein
MTGFGGGSNHHPQICHAKVRPVRGLFAKSGEKILCTCPTLIVKLKFEQPWLMAEGPRDGLAQLGQINHGCAPQNDLRSVY